MQCAVSVPLAGKPLRPEFHSVNVFGNAQDADYKSGWYQDHELGSDAIDSDMEARHLESEHIPNKF